LRQLDDAIPAIRHAQHAAQRGEPLVREEPCRNAVRGDHEVLDQLLRAIRLVGTQSRELLAVEHGARLRCLELERATLVADVAQALRDAVLRTQLRVQPVDGRQRRRRGRASFEPRRDAVVRKLCVVAHDGTIDVGSAMAPLASTAMSTTTASRS
jgi:hypothetical protein